MGNSESCILVNVQDSWAIQTAIKYVKAIRRHTNSLEILLL